MRNYVLSGYLFGLAWGWLYALIRWPVPQDLSLWQVGLIGFFGPMVSSGLIGSLVGLVVGLLLSREKQKHPTRQTHPQ